MPTVTKSIGSAGGRDYSTLAGWAAGLPANLVTDGNSYRGECYSDSEFVDSFNVLDITGHTTDATHFITLTTAAGQSFRDNANVQSNALRYDAANGVAIRSTAGIRTIGVRDQYTVISNLQIQNDSVSYFGHALYLAWFDSANITIDDCIISSKSTVRPALSTGTTNKHRNSLIVQSGGMPPIWEGKADLASGGTYYFCTIVAPSDAAPPVAGILTDYGSPAFENCAFFGCMAVYEHDLGSGAPTFTTCMTDVASPPSGVAGGKTYANQFQNTTIASGDWRQKTGADLQGAGTSDSTNGATDIAGTSRPVNSNWDIGAWELATVNFDLDPSLYVDSDTFYSPTALSLYDLTPSLYSDTDTFYIPVVGAGVVDLTPSLYIDADTFFSPDVTTIVDLDSSLYTNSNVFYIPTFAEESTDLSPSLYTNNNLFYTSLVATDSIQEVEIPTVFGGIVGPPPRFVQKVDVIVNGVWLVATISVSPGEAETISFVPGKVQIDAIPSLRSLRDIKTNFIKSSDPLTNDILDDSMDDLLLIFSEMLVE